MDSTETRVFSVIVKIWVEDSGQPTWHGQITHIPSGERRYVNRTEDIALVVGQYLEQLGVRLGWCMQVWRWGRRLMV